MSEYIALRDLGEVVENTKKKNPTIRSGRGARGTT